MGYLIRGLAALGLAGAIGFGLGDLDNGGTKTNALESPIEIALRDISWANGQYNEALRYFDNAHKFERDSPMQTHNLNNSREMIAGSFDYLQNARATLFNHQLAEGLPADDGCDDINDESLIRAEYELNLMFGKVYALKGDIKEVEVHFGGVEDWKESTDYLKMAMGCGSTEEEKDAIEKSIEVNKGNISMSLIERLEKSRRGLNI